MLQMTPNGLYCEVGDFYIDPSRRVERAVITHAHSDHARRGMGSYLAHHHTVPLLKHRLGKNISAVGVEYGASTEISGVRVSLHPSGHIFGSAQVRLEHHGEVWVVTGDYKRETDPIAAPFEVVPCHTFVTETTFALPVYRWPDQTSVVDTINAWWRSNAENGCLSVIRAYSLGKTQRILAQLDENIGAICLGDANYDITQVMSGVNFPRYKRWSEVLPGEVANALIITSTSLDLAYPLYVADASGWLAVSRHRRQHVQPFIVSDHVDWPSLVQTVRETGCETVYSMHGFTEPFTRWLREQGYQAHELERGEGRTKQFHAELTTQRAMNIRQDVCEKADLPHWLFDESYGHVKKLSETAQLISGDHTEVASPRVVIPTTVIQQPWNEDQPIWRVNAVLYHLHTAVGSKRIEQFTMGILSGEEIVPLVHVSPDVPAELLQEIMAYAENNTVVSVGPVRTLAPYYVFEIEVASITIAPRRKSGVKVEQSRIVRYTRDADLTSVTTVESVRSFLDERPVTF